MKQILLFLLITHQVYAQVNTSIYPSFAYSDLNVIATEGNVIYTAGNCDLAMISLDSGASWEFLNIEHTIVDIDILPGSDGLQAVFTARDAVLLIDAEELSITQISDNFLSVMATTLYQMHIYNNHYHVVTGGSIYRSSIDQVEWAYFAGFNFEDQDDFVRSTDMVEGHVFAGSNLGQFKSLNLADGESTLISDFESRIADVEMVSMMTAYLDVDNQANFIKTVDGGQNWEVLNNMPEKINPTAFGEDILLSVNTNRFYISTDGGQSSTYMAIPDDGSYQLIWDAFVEDDGKFWFCGRSNMILSSEDFGFTLDNLNDYKRSNLNQIQLTDNGNGYAVGASGSIIFSSDHGDTWDSYSDEQLDSEYFSSLAVFNDGTAFISGEEMSYIFEDGNLLAEVDFQSQSMLKSFIDEVLIAITPFAGEYSIAVSKDQGASWENKAMTSVSFVKMHQSPTGMIYIPTNSEFVYVSNDNGETWDIEEFGYGDIRQVAFLNDMQGIFTSEGRLYKTEDGGQTAEQIAQAYLIQNLHYFNEDQMLYTSAQNSQTQVRFSNNGGTSFSSLDGFCSRTRDTHFDGERTIWIALDGGHINKVELDLLSNTSESSLESEMSIFPNIIRAGQINYLTLESNQEPNDLELFDIMGIRLNNQINYIDGHVILNALVPGKYIIKCAFSEGLATQMIIVY